MYKIYGIRHKRRLILDFYRGGCPNVSLMGPSQKMRPSIRPSWNTFSNQGPHMQEAVPPKAL